MVRMIRMWPGEGVHSVGGHLWQREAAGLGE